jgi:hypothetical protein
MLAVFADMVTLFLAVHPLTRVASGWVTLAGSADGTFVSGRIVKNEKFRKEV